MKSVPNDLSEPIHMTPKIKVTEFIKPFANTREIETVVSDQVYAAWLKIINLGARITIEKLSPQEQISGCIEDPELGDFDVFVCPNNEKRVKDELESMILRFDERDFANWKTMITDGEDLAP